MGEFKEYVFHGPEKMGECLVLKLYNYILHVSEITGFLPWEPKKHWVTQASRPPNGPMATPRKPEASVMESSKVSGRFPQRFWKFSDANFLPTSNVSREEVRRSGSQKQCFFSPEDMQHYATCPTKSFHRAVFPYTIAIGQVLKKSAALIEATT